MNELMFAIELLLTGLLTGLMYSMVALGFVLILKASGVFNFAQGAMSLFAALTVVALQPHVGLFFALILGAAVMVAFGVATERLLLRPLTGATPLTIFMATVAVASILEGAAQIIFGSEARSLKLDIPQKPFEVAGILVSPPDLLAAAVAGIFVVALSLFFKYTKTGLGLRAVADDHAAAQVVGMSLRRLRAVAWALAGVVALTAGVIWGSRIGVSFGMSVIALKALPVLIIGGVESIPGVIFGGLIVGAAEALGEAYIGPLVGGGVQDVMAYAVALAFLLVRPYGLFGQPTLRRV